MLHTIQRDPSLPSFLMPLVCTYLRYEDTVRCMQLNSSFNRYIDNNWSDMTKEEIKICIQPELYVGVVNGSIKITVSFEREYTEEDGVDEDVYLCECTCTIDERSLYSSQPGFLIRNANKHGLISLPHRNGIKYEIPSRVFGLKLLLDSLVLRFAISEFELDIERRRQKISKLELECIRDSFQCHYPPTNGTIDVTFGFNNYDPILNDIAAVLGTETIEIREDETCRRKRPRSCIVPVDTAFLDVLVKCYVSTGELAELLIMDPSNPSTLMRLICPYLSYEDNVRCMQLNSSFNRYIDDNWSDMTKAEINLRIQPGVDIGSIRITFAFEPADDVFPNDRCRCLCTIDSRTLYSSQPGFIMRNAEKHELISIPRHDGIEYEIPSRVFGLKILLDSIEIVKGQQKLTKLELETIRDSLQFHYPPTTGTIDVTFLVNTYELILNDIATALGAKMIKIKEDKLRDRHEHRRFLIPVDTSSNSVLIRSVFCDCTAELIELLNEWTAGLRRIKKIILRSKGQTQFLELFKTLKISDSAINYQTISSVDSEKDMCFDMMRPDGKCLRVEGSRYDYMYELCTQEIDN